jgi:hypothetical protein
MQTLDSQLKNFIAIIKHGPDMLEPDLFAGPVDRVMLGLMAHANTISHARLVALEDSFPRTRNAMGDATFNQLSRAYCDTPAACASDLNQIGTGFLDFLDSHSQDIRMSDLAHIEWAWLKSYHAPEYQPLTLEILGHLTETELMVLPVTAHPAAQLVFLRATLSDELFEITYNIDQTAILVTRPDHDVQLMAIDDMTAMMFKMLHTNIVIGNLLAFALENIEEARALEPILTLIAAGAVTIINTGQTG